MITSIGESGENHRNSTPRFTTAGISLKSNGVVTCKWLISINEGHLTDNEDNRIKNTWKNSSYYLEKHVVRHPTYQTESCRAEKQ